MFKLFRNSKKTKSTKSIAVYISDKHKHLIVAPRHENYAGILYEQAVCFTSSYPIDETEFGEKIINNLELYSIKDSNLRNSKPSDWPAYKHSKCKSIVSFEKEYIQIFIRGVNDSNLVLTIEGWPFKNSELRINSSISFYADKFELGRRVKNVYEDCLKSKI